MSSKLLWYAARSNGLVAWGLLAAAVLWGLALSTKVLGRRPRPSWILDLHRFLGVSALAFTAIHVVTVVLDTYVHFGLVEVLVPFTGAWHPAAVAWGIASLYLLVAIELTSLLRARLPARLWRGTHYLSFPLFGLASIHALSAGTDRHTFAMRLAVLAAVAAVVVLTAVRLATAERHDVMSPPRTPRTPPVRSFATPGYHVPSRSAGRRSVQVPVGHHALAVRVTEGAGTTSVTPRPSRPAEPVRFQRTNC
ncbi:MAG TPA: ferric reductase-like transmembrane domain-containing protein [Acidimicrobiales bacterium]|nr:ferric reductase-like transmembrane domain-containing protein [Acidimicrobiales bacterium]